MARHSCLLLIVLLGLAGPALAEEFIEDFTTTTFKDLSRTTAWWDTTAGELKLYPFEITLAGSLDTPGSAGGVFVDGDYAYVADLLPGLQVIDISDPSNPAIAGSYNTLGDAKDVFVTGDYAYIADTAAGLQVIDIRDPSNPTLAGGVDTPGSARDVFVAGNHAYVADAASGLQVIDIRDPATPALAGSYNTPGSASGVFVAGGHAYVSDEGSGLQVIDISDPINPTLAGSYDTPNIAWGVFVDGNHAFVADGSSGLQVIDTSDPTNPILAGSIDTPGSARAVFVSGDRAYVGDGSSGLQVIDITDPSNPSAAGDYDTPGSAVGVFVSGEHAFVGDGGSGLQVLDVNDSAGPLFVGQNPTQDRAVEVFVSGDHAFVADGSAGLIVIDISDLSNPTLVGSYDPGFVGRVRVAGDYAYVMETSAGLVVFDISDPTQPIRLGSYNPPGTGNNGLFVSGDRVFAAAGNFGLQVIDISDPTNPTLAGGCFTVGVSQNVFVAGDHAFVADGLSGLTVVDITDPANPIVAGNVDTPGEAFDVFVSGDHALVADGDAGIRVVDVHDPTSPTLAGGYPTQSVARGVFVAGDQAHVSDETSGLVVFDISNPTNPFPVRAYDTPGTAGDVFIAGENAFVADYFSGLQVLQVYAGWPFDATENHGYSVAVNSLNFRVVRVRLATAQTEIISWEVSGDRVAWNPILPDWSWTRLIDVGSQLAWRSTHTYDHNQVNPACSELRLGILYEPGVIHALADVPEDQGGWLRLRFARSGYDFAAEASLPVTGYGVHRRVDDAELKARVLTEAPAAAPSPDPSLSSFAGSALRSLGGRLYLDSNLLPLESEFPPGIWELVSWVPALQQDEYLALVPTVGDSTVAGTTWSVYVTTTHTTTPSVWFVSHPDSGYSIDNIPPSAPTGLDYNAGTLTWDECPDEDFHYFTVYGGDTENFALAELIGYTIETTFDVSGSPFAWYFVTATDFAGGESEPASVESGTAGVESETGVLPIVYALHPASPNPFNGQTVLTFDLPERGFTRLEVYDLMGRLVEKLVTDELPAGRHRLRWAGHDARGEALTPGLYFLRLESGRYSATRKLLRVK